MLYLNIRQFEYVSVLADTGSFHEAAEKLGISQPSLSQYIKKIESQIGLKLFERTNGNIRLTDAGRLYIDSGRKILALQHQMEAAIQDLSDNRQGSVIVGSAHYRSAGMLPKIAKAFRRKYPGMHLVVKEGVTSELLDCMDHGEFDLCLMTLPVDENTYAYRELMDEEMLLAVPKVYGKLDARVMPDRRYPAVDARALDRKDFVMLTETQVMQHSLDLLCSSCGITLNKAVVVVGLEAQINMVREGLGMAMMPAGIESFCSDDEVTFYSFQQDLPKRKVVVMWRKDKPLTKAAADLIATMEELY